MSKLPLMLLAVLALVGCGEGMPQTCQQIHITPTQGCAFLGDAYVHWNPDDAGVRFTPCTEAISCAD